MPNLADQVAALTLRVSTEFKAVRSTLGANADLTTSTKSTLVGAINEVRALAAAAGIIDDGGTSTTKVWSSSKTNAAIQAAVSALVAGAPAALDTLGEIVAQLQADEGSIGTIMTALTKRVRVDAAQSFTSGEQAQGRSNIGAASAADLGDPATDYVAIFNAGLQ